MLKESPGNFPIDDHRLFGENPNEKYQRIIDYVLLIGQNNPSTNDRTEMKINKELEANYQLLYSSAEGKINIYENKAR